MKLASCFLRAAKSNPHTKVAGMIFTARTRHVKEIKTKGR